MLADIVKIGIPSVLSAGLAWGAQIVMYRRASQQREEDKADRLEIHRDELTFELLENARAEMALVRSEISTVREENQALRKMEIHVYHFQQSLDHLEALLTAAEPEERTTAERNARAFLNRMQRMNDAKGTIANEIQRQSSDISIREATDIPGLKIIEGGNSNV